MMEDIGAMTRVNTWGAEDRPKHRAEIETPHPPRKTSGTGERPDVQEPGGRRPGDPGTPSNPPDGETGERTG